MTSQPTLFEAIVTGRPVKGFFNTIGLSGEDLGKAKAQTGKQDTRVLNIFKELGKLTPLEAWRAYCSIFPECPATSIRRSITVLTGLKMLRKTEDMKTEAFGKPNYIWEYVH